jgi:hypothetical protein
MSKKQVVITVRVGEKVDSFRGPVQERTDAMWKSLMQDYQRFLNDRRAIDFVTDEENIILIPRETILAVAFMDREGDNGD